LAACPRTVIKEVARRSASIADTLGIDRFAVMGASGGAPHALACAAVLPGRVLATVCMSAPAPFGAEGLEWFVGMAPSGAAECRAAAAGREALQAYFASAEFDPQVFTPADHAAAIGPWSWLGTVAAKALATDQGGMVDDDLAYVTHWGCDPRQVDAPVLFVHGAQDRVVPSSHARWLAQRCRTAELWLHPDDGHVSILNSSVIALDWLRENARAGTR
jgi:pimeloyl-ACP methyl ester carboxylesterase